MPCAAAVAADPGADLQLSFSAEREPRRISYTSPTSHFHLALQNRGERGKKIWETSNSWGYFNLSFEITDGTGKKWVVKKRDTVFTVNFPGFLAISPGQVHVFDVYFGDERQWEGFPLQRGKEQSVQMRALYAVPETADSKTSGVWTGRIESERVKVTFVK